MREPSFGGGFLSVNIPTYYKQQKMKGETNMTNERKICPKCGGRCFDAMAHVTQKWEINEYGEFIDTITDCSEVTHAPSIEDVWTCVNCSTEAIPEKEFLDGDKMFSTDEVVLEVKSTVDFWLCGENLGRNCYISMWKSENVPEDENCNLIVGYDVYSYADKEQIDGGEMDTSYSETDPDFITDFIPELLGFIFEYDFHSEINWKIIPVAADEFFDD